MSLTSQHNKSFLEQGTFDIHLPGNNPNLQFSSGFSGAVPSLGLTSPVESFLRGGDSRLKTADSVMPNTKRRRNKLQ